MRRGKYSDAELQRIRDRHPITSIVGQFVLWDKRKSNPGRGDMWACCPFHGEKSPSFHADDRKGIYHCFGCGATGDVFKFLTEHTGCSFPDAIAQLGGEKDIELETPQQRLERETKDKARREAAESQRRQDEGNIRESARDIWRQTLPLAGTLGEAYFRHRGIEFPLTFPSLRFHPNLRYRDRATGNVLGHFPAVVAGMQAPDDSFLGIWRIYLNADGTKNTLVPDAKLGLGSYTAAGGGVRLGNPVGRVNLCEGIETGLGIVGITGGAPVMACLNTSGLVNWQPTPDSSSALIWPDGDVDRIRTIKGAEKKVESPGHLAARTLEERLRGEDFPVAVQPTSKNGADYLDVYTRMRKKLNA